MTQECGVRFLTDYLEGDTYLKFIVPTTTLSLPDAIYTCRRYQAALAEVAGDRCRCFARLMRANRT
jgi:hypothetical protein